MALSAFLSVALIHLAAAISPGPSFLVSVKVAANDGFAAAAGLALGFGLGAALWATAAMAGLAALFEVVPSFFFGLKLVGAAFLLLIAFMMWRHADDPLPAKQMGAAPMTARRAVKFGFLTFATNPKPAIFFSAVFVGLVPLDTPLIWLAAIIGIVFANETIWYLAVARLFSQPKARAAYLRLKSRIDKAFGALIAAFGLKIALT